MINREEIIELAKQSGFGNADVCEGMFFPVFERFTKTIYNQAIEDALNKCAEIDIEYGGEDVSPTWLHTEIRKLKG